MRVTYDPEADILYLRLSEAEIVDSESIEPNLVVDRDADDRIVGVEILWPSRTPGTNPLAMAFEVLQRLEDTPAAAE